MTSSPACIPRAILGANANHVPGDDDVAEEAMQRALVPSLYRALRALPEPRSKEVLVLRYGLLGVAPLSLREIGARWDVAPATVLTAERKALELMRELL